MKYLSFLIILFLYINSFSQGSITASADTSTVFCGMCTDITASGDFPDYSEAFDFSNGWPLGWDVPICGMLNNPCGGGSGQYAWMGDNTPAPRTLSTDNFNTSCGGIICFDFKMAAYDDNYNYLNPCEDPDAPSEGIYFQYSINGGLTWTTIFYFQPVNSSLQSTNPYYSWNNHCFTIPQSAMGPNTMFRWHQEVSSGPGFDHWGIDNVEITLDDCGYYYDWLHIDGYPDNPIITVCPNSDTSYTVVWTNGVDEISTTVDINIDFSNVDLSLNTTQPIDSCGGCVQISGNILNMENITYDWNWYGPNFTYINDSTILSCPYDDALYSVSISSNGCEAQDSILVDVDIPLPETSLYISPNECSPASIEITNLMSGNNCIYRISGPNYNYVHHGCSPYLEVYDNVGVYDIDFMMTTDDGCVVDSLYYNAFEVYQTPEASFKTTPSEGTVIDNVIQFNNTTYGGEFFDWDLGDGETSTLNHVTHQYNEVGVYDIQLIASTKWDCVDTAYSQIEIKDDFYMYVPNTFTPDADEFNNEFKPQLLRHDIWNYHMIIYNRWGEILFESYNSDFGWDGTYGGQLVKSGVYVWVIKAGLQESTQIKEYKGYVTLLR